VTVVHGRAGSGKSALLAKITDDIKSSVKNGTTVSLFMRTVGRRRRRRRRRRSAHSMR
jgi:ABC-type molybdenum transport system ATPase subunit/photorepair protein PhrA